MAFGILIQQLFEERTWEHLVREDATTNGFFLQQKLAILIEFLKQEIVNPP